MRLDRDVWTITFAAACVLAVCVVAAARVPFRARASYAGPSQAQGLDWREHACPNCVLSLRVTSDAAWVGTMSAGLIRHDLSTGAVTRHSVAGGLGGRGVYEIAVAADGDVWVATRRDLPTSRLTGVSHFDGSTWRSYGIADGVPDAVIDELAPLPGGRAFVVADRRLAAFDGAGWSLQGAADGLTGNAAAVALAPDGTVHAGTTDGLFQRAGSRWVSVDMAGLPGGRGILDLAIGADAQVWALLNGGAVGEWAPGPGGVGLWRTWDSLPGRSTPFDTNDEISVDASGRPWVVSSMTAWVLETSEWRRLGDADAFLSASGYQPSLLTVAPDGALWLGLRSEGLARFDGTSWARRLVQDGPSNLIPMELDRAPDGAMWVGLASFLDPDNVLNRWSEGTWQRIDGRHGLPPGGMLGVTHSCLDVDDRGRAWVTGWSDWLAWSDDQGRSWATATVTQAFGAKAETRSLAADGRGGVWLGSSKHGVAHFDGTAWRRYTTDDGLPPGTVYCVAVEGRGEGERVWVGTAEGIGLLADDAWSVVSPPGPTGFRPSGIQVDNDGRVWFAGRIGHTGDTGSHAAVLVLDGGRWSSHGAQDGLTGSVAWSVEVDASGRPWVALMDDYDDEAGGVAYLDAGRWRVLDASDGVISGTGFDVAFDGDGDLWAATMAGISQLPAEQVPTPLPTPTTPPTTTPPNHHAGAYLPFCEQARQREVPAGP